MKFLPKSTWFFEKHVTPTCQARLFLLAGPVSLSTAAQLVAPSVVVKGTLSVTSSELYFEVDEEDPNFKKIDPKVRRWGWVSFLWNFCFSYDGMVDCCWVRLALVKSERDSLNFLMNCFCLYAGQLSLLAYDSFTS